MEKATRYEGMEPGLTWNTFRSAYSKQHPKTPLSEVSAAYAEYKSGKVSQIVAKKKSPTRVSPKKSPKKQSPKKSPKKIPKIQDALDNKTYGAMKLLLAASELDNRIDTAKSAVVLVFEFGSKMSGTTETIDEIEIRLRENKQTDTLKRIASRLVFLDDQADILQAYLSKKAPRKPATVTSVDGDTTLLIREVAKLWKYTSKRQSIVNYIVEHAQTKIRYVITEMREIRTNVVVWTIGGWFATLAEIEANPVTKHVSPQPQPSSTTTKRNPTLLGLLRTMYGYGIITELFERSGEAERINKLKDVTVFIPSDRVLHEKLGDAAALLLDHHNDATVLVLLRSLYITNTTIHILKLNSITHYYFKGLSSAKTTSRHYTFTNANDTQVQIVPARKAETVPVTTEIDDPANLYNYRLATNTTISTTFNSKNHHDISNGIVYPIDNVILNSKELSAIDRYLGKPLATITPYSKYANILNLFTLTKLDKVIEQLPRVTVILPRDSALEEALGRNVLVKLLAPVRGQLPDIPALLSILCRLIVPGRELEDIAIPEETDIERVTTVDIDNRRIRAVRKGETTTITTTVTGEVEQHVSYTLEPLWLRNGVVLLADNILISDDEYREILGRVTKPSSPPRLKTKEEQPLLQRKRTPPSKETLIRPLEKAKINYIPGTYQTEEESSEKGTKTKYVTVSEPYAVILKGESKPKLIRLTDAEWTHLQPQINSSIQLVPKRERPLFNPVSISYDRVRNHIVFRLEARELFNRSTRVYSYAPTTAIVDQLETVISKPYTNSLSVVVGIHADQV